MNTTRVAPGCVGLVLGGGGELLVGARSSYALAGLVTSWRETQASLTVLIVPAVAFIGSLTVGATLAWLATRSGPLLAISAPGWVVLMGVLALGLSWTHGGRAGTDFRWNTCIGDLEPATFDAFEGRAGDGSVRHRLTKEESRAVTDGEHAWLVGEEDGSLTCEFR